MAYREDVRRINLRELVYKISEIDKIEEIKLPEGLKDAIDLGSSTGAEQVTE